MLLEPLGLGQAKGATLLTDCGACSQPERPEQRWWLRATDAGRFRCRGENCSGQSPAATSFSSLPGIDPSVTTSVTDGRNSGGSHRSASADSTPLRAA